MGKEEELHKKLDELLVLWKEIQKKRREFQELLTTE